MTPRYVLSTHFGLTSSISTGLFRVVPVTGFLLGIMIERRNVRLLGVRTVLGVFAELGSSDQKII